MNPAARSFLIAMIVLTLLGVLFGGGDRHTTPTSFGKLPSGYGAVYDLLLAAGVPATRSYGLADAVTVDAAIWWVAPWGLCTPDPTELDPDASQLAVDGLDRWVTAGGRALVFLGAASCIELAGHAVPSRTGAAGVDEDDERGFDAAEHVLWEVNGAWTPMSRTIEGSAPRVFASSGEWEIAATLAGRPFALERRHGEGTLTVVADSFLLRNDSLAAGDAAPLVIDLVRRYGPPVFDERQHGLRLETGAVRYLLTSPARYLFAGLAVLGLAVAWWGRARRPHTPPQPDTPSPTLEGFVASLARIYGRSRDRGRVAARYLEVARAQLRRHYGLPPRTPWETVEVRLERAQPGIDREALRQPPSVRGEGALRAWARELDRIVEEACR